MLFTFVSPMLAVRGTEAFDDADYVFEPKWDGYRVLLHKEGKRIEAYDRHGRIVTFKFPELQEAIKGIDAHSAILDCEGVCLRGQVPDFDDMRYRMRITDPLKINLAVQTHPVTFIAFDLLYKDEELIGQPLFTRSGMLRKTVTPNSVLAPSLQLQGTGTTLQKWSQSQNLEGIVAKKLTSVYTPGKRSEDWIKIRNIALIDTVILGYRESPRFELITGAHFPTVKNKPIAYVSDGITEELKASFMKQIEGIPAKEEGTIRWLEPRLCCSISYGDRTEMHHLNDTRFLGFLPNKDPKDCTWRVNPKH